MIPPYASIGTIAVGTPVTRRPPHRSRRAVFPHRAPQPYSLPHSLAIPCSEVGIVVSDPSCSVNVSFAGCVWLSARCLSRNVAIPARLQNRT